MGEHSGSAFVLRYVMPLLVFPLWYIALFAFEVHSGMAGFVTLAVK